MVSKCNQRIKSLHSEILRYTRKSVELGAIKQVVNMLSDKLQQREQLLKEEYDELDTLNYTVWSKEDTFCNRVWVFAAQRPFGRIFTQGSPRAGTTERATLSSIQNEIASMKNDIRLISTEESGKIAIVRALNVLKNLQTFSEEIKSLLRQLHILKPGSKKQKGSTYCLKNSNLFGNHEQRMDKCDSTLKNIFYTHGDKENHKKDKNYLRWNLSFSTYAKSVCNVATEKRVNFAVKKRSSVSLKFERRRRYLK